MTSTLYGPGGYLPGEPGGNVISTGDPTTDVTAGTLPQPLPTVQLLTVPPVPLRTYDSIVENRLTAGVEPTDVVVNGHRSVVLHGSQSVDALGTVVALTGIVQVLGSADPGNEYAPIFGVVRMGTSTKPANGRVWVEDVGAHGPIGVQAALLTGSNMFLNNYHDSSPTDGPAVAFVAVTKKGTGPAAVGAGHDTADTFPLDYAFAAVGKSRAGGVDGIGWRVGYKAGGFASGWMLPGETSIVGTGVDVEEHTVVGLHVHDPHQAGAPAAWLEGDVEITAGDLILEAPGGGRWRVQVADDGTLATVAA